ncbi:PepSY domain-containing protein [Vibrio mimicus]|uniref:PepSY domain-containing protein n=1 Tax=Vibrio mimicus TaxID=674 RepID=UPI002F9474C4
MHILRMPLKPQASTLLLVLFLGFTLPAHADNKVRDWEQGSFREGTQIEIDEDQDDVYQAVQKGLIRPFAELYATVDQQLNGRLIKVELDEDDSEWTYELKLVYDSQVFRVEYNAATLELMSIRGRNVIRAIKK